MKFEFGKRESLLIKGIAIILMFYHHFFGFPTWLASDCNFIQTNIGGYHIENIIASFCKICVGLYVFVSGYSLFVNYPSYSTVKSLTKRILSFLLNYWFVFAIFILFGLTFNEPLPSLSRFLQQCFGVSTATGFNWAFFDTIHPVFAWYVSFYILFLLISPLLAKLCKFDFIINVLIVSIALFGGSYIINILLPANVHPSVRTIITSFATWGQIGMIGFLFAKHDIFNVMHKILSEYFNKLVLFFLMVFMLGGIFLLWSWVGLQFYTVRSYMTVSFISIYTPIFIYAIINILNIINSKALDTVLISLSKESTNMWFLHGLFFTPNKTIQWLAYLPQYPVLILVWTLLLMYGVSFVLNKVIAYIHSLQKKIFAPNDNHS